MHCQDQGLSVNGWVFGDTLLADLTSWQVLCVAARFAFVCQVVVYGPLVLLYFAVAVIA